MSEKCPKKIVRKNGPKNCPKRHCKQNFRTFLGHFLRHFFSVLLFGRRCPMLARYFALVLREVPASHGASWALLSPAIFSRIRPWSMVGIAPSQSADTETLRPWSLSFYFSSFRKSVGKRVRNEFPGPLGPQGPKSRKRGRKKKVKMVEKQSILTPFRLRFRLFGPRGQEAPGTHFRTLFLALGPKGPNDPCSRARESQMFGPLGIAIFRKIHVSVKFVARDSGDGNGRANFMGDWHFLLLSVGKPPCP